MSSSRLQELANLVSHDDGLPVRDLKVALTRLSAEINTRTAKGSASSYDFFIDAVHSIGQLKGPTHADLRLKCLFDSGLFFYRSGKAKAALETAAMMDVLARRVNDKSWVRKAHSLYGIVHGEAGNIADAVMHYCEALRIARATGDRFGEIATLINLGSAFVYGSLHSEAIRSLMRALDLCTEPEFEQYRAVAYCDIAQSYLALEKFDEGFEAANRCLEYSSEPHDGPTYFSRTIREYTYVQLALEVGKLARAREHAAACLHYSRWGDNPRCKTLAQLACGLCDVREGKVARGLAQLERALETSGDFLILRIDALNALVKAYDETGQPEKALKYLTEMLSFVRAARESGIRSVLNIANDSSDSYAADANDVRALELREARLRAKVAEADLLNSQFEMLERIAVASDLKEDQSGKHGYRVGRLAALLAKRIGFPVESVRDLETAARLHDVGKLGVPDRIIFGSVPLRQAERRLMEAHTVIGGELLGRSKFGKLQLAEQIARHHHERWDGGGYPSKLSGKRIPVQARIVALADVFDALTHGRPYAPAWPVDQALEEIKRRQGTHFDPDLTDTFLVLIDDLRREHPDLDAFLAEASRNSPFLQAREKIRHMTAHCNQDSASRKDVASTVH